MIIIFIKTKKYTGKNFERLDCSGSCYSSVVVGGSGGWSNGDVMVVMW